MRQDVQKVLEQVVGLSALCEQGNNQPLSDAERAEWEALVERGRVLREKRQQATEDAIGDLKKVAKHRADHPKKGKVGFAWQEVPVCVQRFLLARHGGLNIARASELSGVTWPVVNEVFHVCEEARCVRDVMHADSRALMTELAYASMEEVLAGGAVTKQQFDGARLVLERLETDHFAKPAERSGLALEGAKVIGGGITIQLVDVSKGYRPPAAAQIGDGDEGVTV